MKKHYSARPRGTQSHGWAYHGSPTKPVLRVFGAGAARGEPAVCVECGFTVGTRADGTIASHRVGCVGRPRLESWPCAGSGG